MHSGNPNHTTVWVDDSGKRTSKVVEIKTEGGEDMIWVDGEEVDVENINEDADGNVFVIQKKVGKDGKHEIHKIKTRKLDKNENVMILSDEDTDIDFGEEDNEDFKKIKIRVTKDDGDDEVNTYVIKSSDDASQFKGKSQVRMRSDLESLIYIDGKKASRKEMNQLDPSEIKTINVWKGDKATEKYGKKAKEGVIEIITKKGN